jgi:hypothetical protein
MDALFVLNNSFSKAVILKTRICDVTKHLIPIQEKRFLVLFFVPQG